MPKAPKIDLVQLEPEAPAEAPAEARVKVKLQARFPGFVDLVTNTRFGEEPVMVEMHPWLQAQVDAGHLVVVE